ncbi:NUDIX domain-containing protein [Vaginella massiliensis]|uniref:NUDIX hydrolase n=1 Tax=Vaginella massiliensis TaxID=1816680 RepID=UPI003750603D
MKTLYIANALVLNPRGELLVVRKKGSKYFQLVGGKIEANEKPFETLQREFLEEINLDITQHQVLFLGQHHTLAVNEKNTRVHAHIYQVELSQDTSIATQAEIEELLWLNRTNYKNYQLAHLLSEFALPRWLEKFNR